MASWHETRKRRPPRKICQVCGTEFYAYGRTSCARCWAERADDRSELVKVIRSDRETRRPGFAEAKTQERKDSLSYGDLPEGF